MVRRVILDEVEAAVEVWGDYRRKDSMTPVLSAIRPRDLAPRNETPPPASES
ncbi:MAG: hypothetical protein JKY65_24085 [Planctomycetes bacterium]|nr:hypothetical protein [Planctomycetota bacterium]